MRAYALLFVAGMSVAAPVSAQFYRSPAPLPRTPVLTTAPATRTTAPQTRDIFSDIHEGAQSGQLSHKQAKELRREAEEISLLEQRYAEGGLSDSEAAELSTRAEVLRSIVNAKRSHVIK
jgi:hypothetical protein